MLGIFGLCPFIPSSFGFFTEQEATAKCAIMFLVSLFFIKDKWLKLFLAYSVINVVLVFSKRSFGSLQTLFFYMVLYQVLADNMTRKRIYVLLDTLCLLAVIQAGMMLLQYNGVWIIIKDMVNAGRSNISGITTNPNIASSMMALCIPAFLRKRRMVYLLFILPALILNGCLQGILISGIVITVYLASKFSKKDRMIFVGGVLVIAATLLYLSGEYMSFVRYDRLPVWYACFKYVISKTPWVGVGLGHGCTMFPIISQKLRITESVLHPHNEFIFLWMQTGIVGLMFILGYLIQTVRGFIKDLSGIRFNILLGFITVIGMSCVGFPFHVTIAIIPLIYLAMMEYERKSCINV